MSESQWFWPLWELSVIPPYFGDFKWFFGGRAHLWNCRLFLVYMVPAFDIAPEDQFWDDICESKIFVLKMLKLEKVRQLAPQKNQQQAISSKQQASKQQAASRRRRDKQQLGSKWQMLQMEYLQRFHRNQYFIFFKNIVCWETRKGGLCRWDFMFRNFGA